MKTALCFLLCFCIAPPIFGGEIVKMVIGKYVEPESRRSNPRPNISKIKAVIEIDDASVLRPLLQNFKEAKTEDVNWYMYDSIPVYFLDGQGKVVIGLEYWPVTKPHGGFREIRIHQENGMVFSERDAPQKSGYVLPQLARFIDSRAPEGFVWPSKEKK